MSVVPCLPAHLCVSPQRPVVPRPQSTGPRDTYIVRRVCQGPPFARWRRGVREGGALPPTWDPPAVVVGDEEGNTFMGEWYCPQVTISSFSDAKKNTKKREEHSAMFRGWGRGANPKTFFFGISDFATVKVAEDREERGLPSWANEEVEWEVPCELLLSLAHPLGRAVRKTFWDKGDLGDVRVPAHQHAEEVYQRGEHLRLREWSPDDVADYEERLRYFQGDHVFVGGEGVEGAEEEEGEEAEEEEVEEAEEEEVEEAEEEEGREEKEEERQAPADIEPELSIEVDVDAPPQPPAPRPKPSPKPPAKGAAEASAGVQVWGEEGVGGECEPWHAPRGPGCILHPGEVGGPAPPPDPPAVGCPPWRSGCGAPVCPVF